MDTRLLDRISDSMDIKDFTVGQKVYVELTGNAKRYKKEDELIEEWEVVKVGRK